MRALTDTERRLSALAILVVLIAAVWLILVRPVLAGFDQRRQARDEMAALYARNERLIAALPAWRRMAEAQRTEAGRFAIAAPTQALAVEALKQRLVRTVTAAGGVVGAAEDSGRAAGKDGIAVRLDAQVTVSQLYETLRRLQAEEPYVVVEYLSVTADRAFETGRAGPVSVRLEVSARYRPADVR